MKALRWFVGSLILAALLFTVYSWIVLHWNYSEGERAGYVQKLSKKGWVCKTWEGELALVTMPGTVGEKFFFTVRSDAVADQINHSIGRRVALAYDEHVGIPTSCFGDTRYFVSAVKIIEDPAPLAPVPSPKSTEKPAPNEPPSTPAGKP
ncbi:MAG: hypothetical protein ACKVP2_01980 [Burkholderiales bacterium]